MKLRAPVRGGGGGETRKVFFPCVYLPLDFSLSDVDRVFILLRKANVSMQQVAVLDAAHVQEERWSATRNHKSRTFLVRSK